jgi:RNA polymerase sigma-70 factor (ECF subfamily)
VLDPVRRYLLRRCTATAAEEVLSSVLEVLWRRLEEVPEGSEVAWSIGVARLALANVERSERRWRGLLERVKVLDPPRSVLPEDEDGLSEELAVAMSRLGARDVEVLRLWAWEGLEGSDLGVALGTKAGTAAVRLHRAKARLSKAYARSSRGRVIEGVVADR